MAQSPFEVPMQFEYGVAQQLSPRVRRLVCNNPGKFTYKGTNSYLLGTRDIAVIDPGPVDEDHLQAILNACKGQNIRWIISTHTHADHSPNGEKLRALTGAKTAGFPPVHHNRGMTGWGDKMVDREFLPDIALRDGDILASDEWTLQALHTPGHAPDHLCLALKEESALFSGDHVMGWSTSVIAPPEGRMADYMRTLDMLLKRTEDKDKIYYPAHGGEIPRPRSLVRSLLMHRQIRERNLLDCLEKGLSTIDEFVADIYKDTQDALLPAAKLSLLAQLDYLEERGKVTAHNKQDLKGVYQLVFPPSSSPETA